MKRALFLDRDGVINKEVNYLYKIEDFEFIDGVFETCQFFQDKDYAIVIITNQAGIARGIYSEDDYLTLTSWLLEQFREEGVLISRVYHCPHHPEFGSECHCRKPEPQMLYDAERDLGIDLKNSILVGDKNSDILAGINAGIKNNYLISTGHKITENKYGVVVLNNLRELCEIYGK
jgi:D-glycero-D-manno-heptose 1,7-bisphosphate phosphatase